MLRQDSDDQVFERWFAEKNRDGLTVLFDNYLYAGHRRQSSAEFAVSIRRLRAAGVDEGELQWLIQGEYVLHVAGRGRRQLAASQEFDDDSHFILTEKGVAFVTESIGSAAPALPGYVGGIEGVGVQQSAPDRPAISWDAKGGVLCVDDAEIRRVRKDGKNLRRILDAFQKAGWPARIRDPFPAAAGTDTKLRLRNAVQRLNNRIRQNTIAFHTCGDGTGVRWDRASDTT